MGPAALHLGGLVDSAGESFSKGFQGWLPLFDTLAPQGPGGVALLVKVRGVCLVKIKTKIKNSIEASREKKKTAFLKFQ